MLNQHQKRLITFSIFIVLILIFTFVDIVIFKALSVIVIVIYVGFLIFLRNEPPPPDLTQNELPKPQTTENTAGTEAGLDVGYDETQQSSFSYLNKRPSNQSLGFGEDFRIIHHRDPVIEMPFDLKERYSEIANEDIPSEIGKDGQFSFILEKLLTILKDSFHSHSAIFFWYLKSKGKLSVEKYVSNSKDVEKRRLDIVDDILSNIVESGEPKLLNGILPNVEADVIRYYEVPQSIKCVVGVPVFYNENLIGVLVIDSKETDAYGIETIYSMGRFVRLITMTIQLFEERFTENVSQKRLDGLIDFITPLSNVRNDFEALDVIEENINQLFHWDAFVLCLFQPDSQKFTTAKVINKTALKFVGENLGVELKGTLAAKCIISGNPIIYNDTTDLGMKRFSHQEDISFTGSLLYMPLIFNKQNYGLLCFESLKKDAYSNDDIKFLKSISSILSYIMYSYTSQTVLRNYSAYDMDTRVLNLKMFKTLMEIEFQKVHLLQLTASVALLRIDDFPQQETLFEESPVSKLVKTVATLLKEEIPATSYLARVDEMTFAIYFYNMSPQDVFIWGEKIRVKIVRLNLQMISKQTTFTASIGIASLGRRSSFDEVYADVELALQKALQSGGNKTTNIN